jgi:thioredoxin 1
VAFDKELEEIRRRKMERLVKEASASSFFRRGEVAPLTDASFSDALAASRRPVLVDFWASWCGPCQMIAPIVEDLAGVYAGRVDFGKLDVDANPLTAQRFNVQSIPTLILFEGGRVADRMLGAQGRATVEAMLVRRLSASS